MKFNKKKMAVNIKKLAKNKGIKIGKIESQAGVSPGYVSRLLNKQDNATSLLMDLLTGASELLGVSADSLLNTDFDALSSGEAYLLTFYEKLLKDTQNGNLFWTTEAAERLEKYLEYFPHPLIYIDKDDFEYPSYHSIFSPLAMMGDFSVYAIINNKRLYITQVFQEDEFDNKGYEIYFTSLDLKNVEKIDDVYEGDNLFNFVKKLFNEATLIRHQVEISPSVQTLISGYMGDTTINKEIIQAKGRTSKSKKH